MPERFATPDYLAGLNPEQQQAVTRTEGPSLVLAGAGTGKTRVLTTRIAHLLMTKKAFPGQVLAVTFTNKAAREMKERVAAMIGNSVDGMWIGTFHSMGVRILRRHAPHLGLSSQFTILDTDDQIRLLKTIMAEHHLDEKRWPAKGALAIIQGWKDKALTPDKLSANEVGGFANGRMHEIYRRYQSRLEQLNAVDFGDLILHCITLFSKQPEVLESFATRFRYILVDEYQDTNIAQYLLLRLLAASHQNLCCVGDDDQSIYSWRGAEVGHILKFEKDFPDATVTRLERNYRSTPQILAAASGLIAHNSERLGKTLWTEDGAGEKIIIRSVWDDRDEARTIAESIEALQRRSTSLNDMAILVRAGFQTRSFEEQFLSLGIPYRVIGGLRFYERKEIRDMIAYLRVIVQPDDDLALERIINVPRRGIGKATLEALQQEARAQGISLYRIISQQLEQGGLKGKARTELAQLWELFTEWRSQSDQLAPGDLVERILERTSYQAMLEEERSEESATRLENLKELVHALDEFETVILFLEHVGLVADREMDANASDEMVTLMTLHGSKGLEFHHVYLPGWEEGLFPHQRALDESGKQGLEEERRLAYVGITRARQTLTITHAAGRRVHNQFQHCIPSRFLDEVPDEHVERISMDGGPAGQSRQRLQEQIDSILKDTYSGDRAYTSSRKNTSPIKATGTAAFPVGCKVEHATFGEGRVLSAKEDRLEICFNKAGVKKLLQEYVTKKC